MKHGFSQLMEKLLQLKDFLVTPPNVTINGTNISKQTIYSEEQNFTIRKQKIVFKVLFEKEYICQLRVLLGTC